VSVEPEIGFSQAAALCRVLQDACKTAELLLPMPMSCAEPLRVSVPTETLTGSYIFLMELGRSWVYVEIDTNEGTVRYLIDGCRTEHVYLERSDALRYGFGKIDIRNFVYALLNHGSDVSIAQLLVREKDNTDTTNILRKKEYGLRCVRINLVLCTEPVDYADALNMAMEAHLFDAIDRGVFNTPPRVIDAL